MISKFVIRFTSSNWIYASKFDELSNITKGKLCLSPTSLSISDVTLRMHQHIFNSDIILCENYRQTNNLLYSLKNKLSYIQDLPQSSDIILSPGEDPSAASEEIIQLSEHLKHNQQMYLMKKQVLSSQEMVRQHQQIKKYNKKLHIKKQLQQFKASRGYGYIIDLRDQQPELMSYLSEGMNVMYLYPQGGQYIKWFLGQVQKNNYPYQILPGPSQLISTLAVSGFPADRFGIQYYLSDTSKAKVNQILTTRKRQCFSVCMYDQFGNLEYILSQIQRVYGAHQMVFVKVQDSKQTIRKQVNEVIEFMKSRPMLTSKDKQQRCVIVIAPYAIQYNSQFKQTQFQKAYLQQLIFSDETTLYEVQKLTKKLQTYKQKKKYEIDSIKAAKYLLQTLPTQEDAISVLKSLLRISALDVQPILVEAKKLPNDVLQIQKR